MQQIAALEQDLKRIAETLGGSVDKPAERHPGYLFALAELQQARLDLARVDVRATMPDIASKPPKQGQYMAAGSTAMALVASDNLWVEVNFTETDLTNVTPGQAAVVRIDTYPSAEWRGVVESLRTWRCGGRSSPAPTTWTRRRDWRRSMVKSSGRPPRLPICRISGC